MNALELNITQQLEKNKPEISMAPLIDVVFLLLIFFVVATIFPDDKGIIVNKPETKTSQMISAKSMTFYINEKNEIYFKDRLIAYTDIKRLVSQQIAATPNIGVVLKVDKKATTEAMIKVMDASKQAGANNVGIATNALRDDR